MFSNIYRIDLIFPSVIKMRQAVTRAEQQQPQEQLDKENNESFCVRKKKKAGKEAKK
jgi:hypothetical protein